MTKTYRIRTTPGEDKNIRININQDFDFLEILSLKLRQDDVYTRFCADYGVVAGRVITNGGYGIPNVNISVFVPLSTQDENDPVISTLYPYKRVDQKNEDGYRYNLLPYRQEYGGHTPTGTFPDREDVLTRSEVLEVYEKYYKYSVKTNESGDFMIIGVPLGSQVVMMDLDLSNIGCFSLGPSDLIRLGIGAPGQFNGSRFKSSTDIDSLPQIVNQKKEVNVTSFWGEEELCEIGITRVDFDLRDLGIEIKPQAIFMGSLISSTEEDFLKSNCKPKKNTGNLCDLTTGSGTILAIRQTIDYDVNGQPVLEQFSLPEGGKVIDDDGTWLVEVPMNLDYVTTDEFGNQVLSNDPSVGIPTKGKYRFRIQYQNEDGLNNNILRADYLVPNVREYGWDNTGTFANVNQTEQLKSYAFSLDWNDYADPQAAIDCEDYFYEYTYNKVYTIANFIDRWKWGYNRSRHLGIKEITDRACTTTNNRFPVNDGVRNFDFLFFLFNLFITILSPVIIALIPLIHIVAFLFPILKWVLVFFIAGLLAYFAVYFGFGTAAAWPAVALSILNGLATLVFVAALATYTILIIKKWDEIKEAKFKGINLPMMSFPDCEACPCDSPDLTVDEINGGAGFSTGGQGTFEIGDYTIYSRGNSSFLADVNSMITWSNYQPPYIDEDDYTGNKQEKYLADQYGVRYAIAGYQQAGSPEMGVGIARKYSPSATYVQQGQTTYSQMLNLMNLRTRYFDTVAPNIIQTTITNPTTIPSQPFTDNILILLCDEGVKDQYESGTVISFNNPNNIIDPNLTGATIQNGFETFSVTGSTNIGEYAVPIKYLNQAGSESTSIVYLSGDSNASEYKYKTGIEYFQVITGMSVSETASLTASNFDSILKRYMLSTIQDLCYRPDNPASIPTPYPSINPLTPIGTTAQKYSVLFLVRGVDVWTKKQKIKYDLSKIFGYSSFNNTRSVEGDFFMNIPIQKPTGSPSSIVNQRSPESHLVSFAPYNISSIYHPPYDFVVSNQYTAVTTNNLRYYSSLDKNLTFSTGFSLGGYSLNFYLNTSMMDTGNNVIRRLRYQNGPSNIMQGNVEGGSLIAAPGGNCVTNNLSDIRARLYSPAYVNTHPALVDVTSTITKGTFTHWGQTINNAKLVMRSDRLPTSDVLQNNSSQLGNSYLLHQNDNFRSYFIADNSGVPTIDTASQATDTTNNAADATGDNPSFTDVVLDTFSCEGMVPLSCYESTTTSSGEPTLSILNPCDANEDPVRVSGGCYRLVQKQYIVGIGRDIKNFLEWKSRFRLMFAACRGIFSHVFQNNWVNGTLYMFTFKKQTIFNVSGQPKKYKFCGTLDNQYREGQGPIYYTEGTTNSFFYRSAPYNGTNFVGQAPQNSTFSNPTPETPEFGGINVRNLFFPTTIMDLGPRDEFLNEICNNPSFNGYIVDTIKSTSFNDTADILQLAIISRLMNTTFLQQLIGSGDASVNQLFSRTEDRLDGDIVQLFSINSEYGVEPFSDDNYSDIDLYVQTNGGPTVGIYFSSDTENRLLISPGKKIFSSTPPLSNYYGFPKSQRVPMYKWKSNTTTTIFGSDTNDWHTTPPYYSQKYQDLNFSSPQPPGISPYFNSNLTGQLGYIYNSDSQGLPDSAWPPGQDELYIVGAPYHFYFGLRKGKSAINRYITKYFKNQDV